MIIPVGNEFSLCYFNYIILFLLSFKFKLLSYFIFNSINTLLKFLFGSTETYSYI